jgi:alkylresorcinol/alkylpyrone synthase
LKVDALPFSQFSQSYAPSPSVGSARAYADLLPALGPRISRLEIVDPETSFSQEEVLALLGMSGDEFARGIFARCGVRRRRLNLSGAMLATTLQGRTREIEDELFGYAVTAVQRLEIDPREIGTVVTATLYSLGGPTLAHRLVDHFGMAPDTDKYHLVGVGCASAVPLMRLLGQSLRDRPGKVGLVVAAESMSGVLVGARAQDAKAKVVGSAIFGDGCAAALLSEDPGAEGPEILSARVHQIAGTLDTVSLELAPKDSYLHLDRHLPDLAAADLGELADAFLQSAGLERAGIDHWLVHPGGRRIIDCAQAALSLSDEDVAVSRDVLANHGNIGTPSIFYVLHRTIANRRPARGERGLMVTVGPGITVGLMLLQW